MTVSLWDVTAVSRDFARVDSLEMSDARFCKDRYFSFSVTGVTLHERTRGILTRITFYRAFARKKVKYT